MIQTVTYFVEFWKSKPYVGQLLTLGRETAQITDISGDTITWRKIPLDEYMKM